MDASESEPWGSFIGKPFGWGWIIINQQGYCDGILLRVSGITQVMFLNVVASSIDESKVRCSGSHRLISR
ncbi:MAG: DUF6334 family protein, partial [Candidatus Acidiferrum sp.]